MNANALGNGVRPREANALNLSTVRSEKQAKW